MEEKSKNQIGGSLVGVFLEVSAIADFIHFFA